MATENGTAAPPQPALKEVSPQPAGPKPLEPEKLQSLRIYRHSNFFYWWIVWAYGFVCAIITRVYGHQVAELFEGKALYVYPRAWLGISFVTMLLVDWRCCESGWPPPSCRHRHFRLWHIGSFRGGAMMRSL